MRLSASYLGWTVLAAAVMGLFVASCANDDGDGTSGAGDGGSSLISVDSVDGVDVLVDAEGRTLYTAEVEQDGQILCIDACASFWEPVIAAQADVEATSNSVGSGDLGVVERPDGETQLTYDGLPLYTFAEEGAGELQGDGFTDDFQGTHFEWAAATVDESSTPSETPDDTGGGFDY